MSLSRFFILMGAVWCLINLAISLLATAVMVACLDPASCSDLALETANTWRPLFWWALPVFAAGTYYGFRTTWPDLKNLYMHARRRRAPATPAGTPSADASQSSRTNRP